MDINSQLNRLAKFLLSNSLKFLDDGRKKAAIDVISSSLNNEFREGKYGWAPSNVVDYQKLYDWNTGGWFSKDAENNIDFDTIDFASVELEVGRFYYSFVLLTQPATILETGVYKGYSTCLIASALKFLQNNGHVYCIDPLIIDHLWENTEIENLITWIPKISQDSLDSIKSKKFDLLVLDSDHSYDTISWELINFEKLLNPGGHILMHDSLYFDGVGAAVNQLYDNNRFEVITLNTPRKSDIPGSRCPGITIVRKISDDGPELKFEKKFKGWFVGDRFGVPYLRKT